MKTFLKVLRWAIVIFATLALLGYLLDLTLTGEVQPADSYAALFWLVAGSIALYYELKKPSEKKSMKPSKYTFIILGVAFLVFFLILLVGSLATQDEPQTTYTNQQFPTAQELTEEPIKPTASGVYLELNNIRKEYGLRKFKNNPTLKKAAELRCRDMVKKNYYDHSNPKTGESGTKFVLNYMLSNSGYDGYILVSENLSMGAADSSEAFARNWLTSKPHKEALLDSQFSDAGVAVCKAKNGEYIIVHEMANFK